MVNVLAGQAANAHRSRLLIERQSPETFAIASYFGADLKCNEVASPERALEMAARRRAKRNLKWLRNHAFVQEEFGIPLVAYEGGQHIVESGRNCPHFVAAQRLPRMKELYLEELQAWERLGYGLYVHFTDISSYGRWGSWGMRESYTETRADAPKYDALLSTAKRLGQLRNVPPRLRLQPASSDPGVHTTR